MEEVLMGRRRMVATVASDVPAQGEYGMPVRMAMELVTAVRELMGRASPEAEAEVLREERIALRVMGALGPRLEKSIPGTRWGKPFVAPRRMAAATFDVRVPLLGEPEWEKVTSVSVDGIVHEPGGFGEKLMEPKVVVCSVTLRFPGNNYESLAHFKRMPTTSTVEKLVLRKKGAGGFWRMFGVES